MKEPNLTAEQLALLRAVIMEYSDIFALDMSELGATNLVSHIINTGDSPPIWQLVRHTPFALCKKIEELVQTRSDTKS